MNVENSKEGLSESCLDLGACLYKTVDQMAEDFHVSEVLIRQLAFENTNKACQEIHRPHCGKGSVSDYIHSCMDVDPLESPNHL